MPHLIDAHVHYNDPAFLERLVAKLDAVEGIAFLLVKPVDFESAKAGIAKHPNRLIGFGEISLDDPRALDLVDLVTRPAFEAWAKSRRL